MADGTGEGSVTVDASALSHPSIWTDVLIHKFGSPITRSSISVKISIVASSASREGNNAARLPEGFGILTRTPTSHPYELAYVAGLHQGASQSTLVVLADG